MPQLNFTAKTISGLKLAIERQVDYWDTNVKGFGLRVSKRGGSDVETRTFFVRYRVGKRRMRRFTIGDARRVSLADARARARAALVAVDQGQDPAVVRQARREAGTFEALAELYMEKHAKRKKRSWRADERNAVDRIKEAVGIDLHPHDLRGTAASHMTARGIPRETVKTILNHVDREVTAIYDRYSYDREKRVALEFWGRQVKAILKEEKPRAPVLSFAR